MREALREVAVEYLEGIVLSDTVDSLPSDDSSAAGLRVKFDCLSPVTLLDA